MNNNQISKRNVTIAFFVAVMADFIQLPIVFAMFASTLTILGAVADVPLETLDAAVDVVVACIMNSLLGFHWTLLPTFVIEIIPGLDAAPVWTLCTAHVYHQRKLQGRIEGILPAARR